MKQQDAARGAGRGGTSLPEWGGRDGFEFLDFGFWILDDELKAIGEFAECGGPIPMGNPDHNGMASLLEQASCR